jgi:ABC-2 type transport system ATP-binding protein
MATREQISTTARLVGSLSSPWAVEAVDLVRDFPRRRQPTVRALDGLSLRVPRGEVHGLLGPNGAGKTTLVKILTTVLLPTSGRAAVCGHDVVAAGRAVRPLIGVVFGGDRGLYTRLTARQNLEFWGALQKLPPRLLRERTDWLLHRLGLADKANHRVETFSRGMKQRVHLARGLIADAQVLFLDEPTMGMDPVAVREFRVLIEELRGEGRTILLGTHDMAEAEALCDRVSFIRSGSIVATRSPHALGDLVSRPRGVEVDNLDTATMAWLRTQTGVLSVSGTPETARVCVEAEDTLPHLLRLLLDHGVTSFRTLRPTLEEVYVDLIGDNGLRV